MKTDTGYCKYCEKQVLIQRKNVNHILHLLLTIATSGFWLIIWFFISLRASDVWRCSSCGNLVKRALETQENKIKSTDTICPYSGAEKYNTLRNILWCIYMPFYCNVADI